MKRFAVPILLFLFSIPGTSQSYRFFNFGLAEGICDEFAYTINQDPQGFLWISTTQGLCHFDGRVFEQDIKGDSIPQSIAHCSLRDSRGRLWFGHENGLVSLLEEETFRRIEPGAGFRSKVTAIREAPDGSILVLCQQTGLMVIGPDLQITYPGDPGNPDDPFANKILYDLQLTAEGHLLVGTSDGITLFRHDQELETYIPTGTIAGLQYLGVRVIECGPRANEYWVGTEDEGLFRITGEGYDPGNYVVEKQGIKQGLAYSGISSIVFNGDRRMWVNDKGVGVHRIDLDENGYLKASLLFDEDAGLPSAYINQIFIDEEGNQWFSSLGNGISVLRDQAFTFMEIWDGESAPDVTAVYVDDDVHWYGGKGQIAVSTGDKISYLDRENGVPDDLITALYVDARKDLYIGTSSSGLYKKTDGESRITPLLVSRNSLENIINAIDGNGDSLFVATNNGVYTYNPATGARTFRNTINGLPHNKINDVLVDHEGIVWIATPTSGLVSVNSDKQFMIEGKPKLVFTTLVEGEDGVIWAGTDGNGVFKFDFNTESLGHYNMEAGLKSDYTYALGVDPKGFIWAGHRMGLSRINPSSGIIRMFDRESGFIADVSHNAVVTAADGMMFMGTSMGVIQYDALQAREDTVPPRLSLKSVLISDVPYDFSHAIKLKYDRYKVRIDFVGINLSNPEQVKYQFKLDGYEDEWSDATNVPYAFYGRVEDGNYTFMVRACDGNGNCSTEPLSLDISVKIPVWKTWWFIISSVLLVLATIFIIFKIRERNQKAIQEYLQRQLDERTREVIQQKEEIEIKNRDITDSINYAQRIQASILPPIRKLHDVFSGSFVFYQPRDIVSGDFYWFEQVGDNKFIIVCADSTGHGVPGAFMSMIGTTMIKDICLRSGIQTPSQILNTLDQEVREALNQNMETSGSNDGMDIIVAEVDMKTYLFRVSSAMRPVIIYSGNEQIYVKGSRNSIGGQLDEGRIEKEFIDEEFQLKKGDIIYMFSDGYPDQFGGPLGRKFKMVRLKNLLRDIYDKPMDEQYNYIKSNFFLWKEDMEQVDDVLFMGIKL